MTAGLDCLKELRTFLMVARQGNIGRVSRRVGMGQSTISHQLLRLEKQLGTTLFVRHGRGVVLTADGNFFLERVDRALQLLDPPLQNPNRQPFTRPERMIIVVPEELSPIINSLCLRGERLLAFPLEIEVANTGLLDRLHDSRVDLAVVQHVGEIEGFNLRLALSDPIGFVATPMHPLAQNLTPLRLRDLSGIPLLLPPRQNWIRQLLDDAAYRVGLTLTMRCVVDRLATIKTLVRENLGCAVMPVSAVQHEVANGTLIFRPISRPSMVGLHAVAHRQNATGDILSLAAILHSELQDYASNGRSQGLRALTPGRCHVEDWYAERENGAKLTG